MEKKDQRAIYLVPGMATDKKIFERVRLPKEAFEVQVLEWLPPKEKEPLKHYVKRMSLNIRHEDPILVGVSFGGVIVQEMSEIIQTEKTIIVSSVKSRQELPTYMKFGASTKLYKLLTASGILSISDLGRLGWSDRSRKNLRQMQAYLSVRDKEYLSWAIKNMVEWEREKEDPEVYHIHGDKDEIFPIKHINKCRKIENGTHAMILDKTPSVTEEILKIINL